MRCFTGYFHSPIGWLEIEVSEKAVRKIKFISALKGKNKDGQTHPYLSMVKKQLSQYFSGQRKKFDVRLELEGTGFQKKIWTAMQKVPYGKSISYKKLAVMSGSAGAARAAGTACRQNKIPVIIPCHRIVPANGDIGQYAGGRSKKKFLLDLEVG